MMFPRDAKFQNDNGTTKTVEFFWGKSWFAKWIGGVNLSPTNKYAGYILGLMIDDQDIVTVRQFNIDDALLKAEDEFGYSRGLSFGQIKAATTEYTWIFRREGADFWAVTYATSNFPATVYVSNDRTPEDETSYFDPRPKFQSIHFGFERDPIRAALLNSGKVSDYALDWIFLQCKMGFGISYFELSDTQYTSSPYRKPSEVYGLKNLSGFDIISSLNFELGVHGTLSAPFASLVGSMSYYYQLPANMISGLYKLTETATGHYMRIEGSPHHGFVARLATAF